jgi:hypothetical protein
MIHISFPPVASDQKIFAFVSFIITIGMSLITSDLNTFAVDRIFMIIPFPLITLGLP